MLKLIAVLAVLAAPAFADDLTGRIGVGGNVGASIPTGSKWVRDNNDAGIGAGAWARYGIDERWSAALAFDYLSFTNNPPGTYFDTVMLSGLYNLNPDSVWNPNFHFGMGPAFVRASDTGFPTHFGLTTGLGVDRFLCRNWSVGAAMDWFYSPKNMAPYHDTSALRLGVNIGLWFGGKAPAPAPTASVRPQEAAKPEPRPVAAPAPAPEKISITLAVNFDTAKSVVKPQYDDQLEKVAVFLKAHSFATAEIEGHTDSVGSAEYNRGLSQRRADAVRQALIDRFSVDGSRLTAKGYGPDQPIADNKTDAGRARNRRVVATFSSGQ